MLSYRHGFHAGNFADVHKHIILTAIVQSLQRKESPVCIIDTHAGAGLYDLDSMASQKNKEYATGIERIWSQGSVLDPIKSYLEIIDAINKSNHTSTLRYYSGSPHIAHQLMRQQDRLVLCEMHTTEYPLLKDNVKGDRRVSVLHQDGYGALKALLPPKERRGLVLIDPAYELKDEYRRCLTELKAAYKRWPTGTFACWYPIQGDRRSGSLLKGIKASGVRKVLIAELCLTTVGHGKKMLGTGMVIINPPWELDKMIEKIHRWLEPFLIVPGEGCTQVEWLVAE
jgi:23S rRNA (adenine2030-N6)-methyltransferase